MTTNHFHAINQQNQVGDRNVQSQHLGERNENETQRFLAAALTALYEQHAQAGSECSEAEVEVFAKDGPLDRFLESDQSPGADFWVQLEPVCAAVKKGFIALGKSALEHWIIKNPRVQPLIDFANVVVAELT